MEHRFGGVWTEIKLDAVAYYLECYTRALTPKGMDTWYIDAFAGTGERHVERLVGGILEGTPLSTITEAMAGSAMRALAIAPPFKHFVFIERDADRFAELQRVMKGFQVNGHPDIRFYNEDANAALVELAKSDQWASPRFPLTRGVVFLDPYALHVDWETLVALAKTQRIDVWYLFPLRDVIRQLAHDFDGIGPKDTRLDRVLSHRWRELYRLEPPSMQADIFADLEPTIVRVPRRERGLTQSEIELWFKSILEEIFQYVSDPLPLFHDRGQQTFSLFLAVSNPSKPATDLARRFHQYVMQNFGPAVPASRRRRGR